MEKVLKCSNRGDVILTDTRANEKARFVAGPLAVVEGCHPLLTESVLVRFQIGIGSLSIRFKVGKS